MKGGVCIGGREGEGWVNFEMGSHWREKGQDIYGRRIHKKIFDSLERKIFTDFIQNQEDLPFYSLFF